MLNLQANCGKKGVTIEECFWIAYGTVYNSLQTTDALVQWPLFYIWRESFIGELTSYSNDSECMISIHTYRAVSTIIECQSAIQSMYLL